MKALKTNFLVLVTLFIGFAACGDDDTTMSHNLDYETQIMQPNAANKILGESMHIHINFESPSAETVHHVNVRIVNQADDTEIYSQPETAHVHEESGYMEFHDDVELTTANGFASGTDWILEARVWGHNAGVGEVLETVAFSVE